ncbi:lipopolysaccharide assembly protein LapB [Paraferrimonas sp. SM1919]|uniref:tetratricopeptide repeat protein n=1 Tax=Paraferrimonas sp. SM1919 TaxID=2662263 RepID=UPI0013D55CC9|nr:hypothetical protein [Paraferrimonas sp. SM1919]
MARLHKRAVNIRLLLFCMLLGFTLPAAASQLDEIAQQLKHHPKQAQQRLSQIISRPNKDIDHNYWRSQILYCEALLENFLPQPALNHAKAVIAQIDDSTPAVVEGFLTACQGTAYSFLNNYQQAYLNLDKAVDIAMKLQNVELSVYALVSRGLFESSLEHHLGATQDLFIALDIYNQSPPQNNWYLIPKRYIYMFLSDIYSQLGDVVKFKEFAPQALYPLPQDSRLKALLLANFSYMYIQLGLSDSTQNLLTQLESEPDLLHGNELPPETLINLSATYLQLAQPHKAKALLTRLMARQDLADTQIPLYLLFAEADIQLTEYESALNRLTTIEQLSSEEAHLSQVQLLKSQLLIKQQDFKSAMAAMELHHQYHKQQLTNTRGKLGEQFQTRFAVMQSIHQQNLTALTGQQSQIERHYALVTLALLLVCVTLLLLLIWSLFKRKQGIISNFDLVSGAESAIEIAKAQQSPLCLIFIKANHIERKLEAQLNHLFAFNAPSNAIHHRLDKHHAFIILPDITLQQCDELITLFQAKLGEHFSDDLIEFGAARLASIDSLIELVKKANKDRLSRKINRQIKNELL